MMRIAKGAIEGRSRRVEFRDFRENPDSVLDSRRLLRGIAVHRWERYIVPTGKSVEDVERGTNSRLNGEVPGDGNAFDHQIHQSRLIRAYAPLDLGSMALVQAGYVRPHPSESRKTEGFRRSKPLEARDIVSLNVAALTHDFGKIELENAAFGEKSAKTPTVRDEIDAAKRFVHRALSEKDPRRARRFERRIMAEYAIDHDETHRLYGLFKLYERFTYLNGAIMAYAEGRWAVEHSQRLVRSVLKSQVPSLVAAAEEGVPSASRFLCERVETITAMFSWVANSGFHDSEEGDEIPYENARKAWGKYLRNHPVLSAPSNKCGKNGCRGVCAELKGKKIR